MSKLTQLFSVRELKELDAKQRAALKKKAQQHVRSSPEIHKILKKKLRPTIKKMKPKAKKAKARAKKRRAK
jgi:hypothetical protein